jgi:hypothetical protein
MLDTFNHRHPCHSFDLEVTASVYIFILPLSYLARCELVKHLISEADLSKITRTCAERSHSIEPALVHIFLGLVVGHLALGDFH